MENKRTHPTRRKALRALTASVSLERVLHDYLETALWSSTDDDGVPLSKKHDYAAWSTEALNQARADCAEFIEKAGDALDGVWHQRVGHDFWLTRNGHGTGFWDQEDSYGPDMAQYLTAVAKDFPEISVVKGKGGLLYFQ